MSPLIERSHEITTLLTSVPPPSNNQREALIAERAGLELQINQMLQQPQGPPPPAGQGIKGTGGKSSKAKIYSALEQQTAFEGDDRIGSTEPQRLPQAASVAPATLAQSYPADEEPLRDALKNVRNKIKVMNKKLEDTRKAAITIAYLSSSTSILEDDVVKILRIEGIIRDLYAEQDSLLELITPETFEAVGSGLKKKEQKNTILKNY